MSTDGHHSKAIDAKARTVRELLGGKKYWIDYFQREYKWQTKQVSELIGDLTAKFLDSYEVGHERDAVANYGHYFLGSVIVGDSEGHKSIIDGQQRLTTLTLLLIFFQRQLDDSDQKGQVADLIFSQQYGKRSFNLDIPERRHCMEALYSGQEFVPPESSESLANMVARYGDIEDLFPAELRNDTLPYFVDWLIEHVQLVEITTYSDDDGYTIFETMNDRGLSLAPTDMLKGYLLAKVTDPEERTHAGMAWKERIAALLDLGKDEDADGIKSWLRSQFALTIRDRKKGAAPGDFDLIATEFHRWVQRHEEQLGLNKSADFVRFIDADFAFYSRWYEKLRRASETLTPGLEDVYFNAENNFTLEYPVLLSPLRIGDTDDAIFQKVRIVAAYLDILIHRRIWNSRSIEHSTMQYAMFVVMREIRRKDPHELAALLRQRLDSETETFSSNEVFHLHGMNGRQIHRLLARMTEYVETRSGMPSRYADYAKRGGKSGFEVEHIWANHAELHGGEFAHPSEFEEYRNRIGGLLLLPKSINASFGDLPYEKKLVHYNSQNLLAWSLNPHAYDHNPGFRQFVEESALPFRAHSEFLKADVDARQDLYRRLAEQIWDPERVTAGPGISKSDDLLEEG